MTVRCSSFLICALTEFVMRSCLRIFHCSWCNNSLHRNLQFFVSLSLLCISNCAYLDERVWATETAVLTAKQQEVERKEIQIPGFKKCKKRRDFCPPLDKPKSCKSIHQKQKWVFIFRLSEKQAQKRWRRVKAIFRQLQVTSWPLTWAPRNFNCWMRSKPKKTCPLHLSVIFDLILQSSMKSVCPRANSHKCLLDEPLCMCVCMCKVLCVYTGGPEGSSVSAVPFLPSPTSQNAVAHERPED